MHIWIDDTIYRLQSHGGISQLWNKLKPELAAALPDARWNIEGEPVDLWMSTYYAPPTQPARRWLVMFYDAIHERYPAFSNHPDSILKRDAIRHASEIVAISQWSAGDCQRFFGRPATVAYCGGSEIQRATYAATQAFTDKPYVLTVGRRDHYKNIHALYQAWGLWPMHEHYRVLALGGEESTPADLAFAASYDWQRRYVSEGDKATAYTGAYALVYPSLYEGFGLPVVEAMATGCPVICDRALTEVGGDAAVYADVTRPASIAAALHSLSDPAYRLERILTGYEQARQFTWARMAQTIAETVLEKELAWSLYPLL